MVLRAACPVGSGIIWLGLFTAITSQALMKLYTSTALCACDRHTPVPYLPTFHQGRKRILMLHIFKSTAASILCSQEFTWHLRVLYLFILWLHLFHWEMFSCENWDNVRIYWLWHFGIYPVTTAQHAWPLVVTATNSYVLERHIIAWEWVNIACVNKHLI